MATKRDLSSLLPATEFLVLEEVAGRWRRSVLTTQRLLQQFEVPVYRLTAKRHLYKLSDIRAVEEKSVHKPKVIVSTVFKPGVISNPKQMKPKPAAP